MKYYDNLMIPVITADPDGEVTYKNKAAKRCIPSPRTKANIFDHINKDNEKHRRDMGSVRIEHIKNDRSIFNRALVVSGDESELWFFSPELQLLEPEDINDNHAKAMGKWLSESLDLVVTDAKTDGDRQFKRYQRVGEELLSAMKYLDIEAVTRFYKLTDIVTSLKEKTEALAGALNLRVSFSTGILFDPHGANEIKFRPFASVYSQLLNLMVRISSTPECSVRALQIEDKLDMVFESRLKAAEGILKEGEELSALLKAFPEETVNILFLEQNIKLMKYKTYYTLNTDGALTVHLYVPINDKKGYPLSQPKPALAIQPLFRRAQKRAHEYLESLFMIIE